MYIYRYIHMCVCDIWAYLLVISHFADGKLPWKYAVIGKSW